MAKILSVNFDLDGTLADLYARPTWLQELRAFDPTPYQEAKTMVNMSRLARHIHRLQAKGIAVNVISWLSKESNPCYDQEVTKAKLEWLRKHLPSVRFDNIYIVAYGVRKSTFVAHNGQHVLIDDEMPNLREWVQAQCGYGVSPHKLFDILASL